MSIPVLHLGSPRCLLVFHVFVSCALLELLEHERFFGNLQCVTVAPTASDFSRTLFLFLLLEEELDVHATYGFFHHAEHLELRIQSIVPPFFHVLTIVLHMSLNTLKFLHHHNFVMFGRFAQRLTDGFSCLSLVFTDCDFE